MQIMTKPSSASRQLLLRLSQLRMFFKSVPKRQYVEAGLVIFVLAGIMWAVTLITPYQPKPQVSFYSDEDTTSAITYHRAQVQSATSSEIIVKIIDGELSGKTTTVLSNRSVRTPIIKNGDIILVTTDTTTSKLSFVDRFRIPGLIIVIALFIALVLIVGRRRGVGSLVGLGVSVVVVGWFIIPLVLAGHNALWVCIAGAYMIAFSSILIAHGRKPRTFISIACVSIVLFIVAVASQLVVTLLGLSGLSDEASNYLAIAKPQIDMAGVLTGGIIIASLGVLDDIVTAQVATVDELQKANTSLSIKELYTRASSVGGEHIASLVNTLALVYVGAALPIIISIASYNNNLLLLLNGEYIATEIIRTIIASAGLVLAVPISTTIAAFILHRRHAKKLRRKTAL